MFVVFWAGGFRFFEVWFFSLVSLSRSTLAYLSPLTPAVSRHHREQVKYATIENAVHALIKVHGTMLPTSTHPLRVSFSKSSFTVTNPPAQTGEAQTGDAPAAAAPTEAVPAAAAAATTATAAVADAAAPVADGLH